jgi:aldose 1-epimerase
MTGTPFGTTPDGRSVELFSLVNNNGLEVRTINYGCALVSIRVPDRHGRMGEAILGCDSLEGYLTNRSYLGQVVGRYANRIAEGRFTLEGRTYELAINNNGVNHLHGGKRGFDKYVWEAEPFSGPDGNGVTYRHVSPDGDESYPGTLRVRVTYTLTDRNELVIDYHATTDKTTVVNLTNHAYFNLAGEGKILDHHIEIHADYFTPVGPTMIPTGEIAAVDESPFDFRRAARIGARIDGDHEQLQRARGFDHNFVLRYEPGRLTHAARLIEPVSGRRMDVHTTTPGMQLYTGNFLDGHIIGRGGVSYTPRVALCLETQHYPDTPNKPHFPSAVVRPDADYKHRTVYSFGLV